MSTSEERKIGFRRGIRAAVTWLHAFGKGMNDPHAKVVLDLAADRLGSSKLQDTSGESDPDPTRAALEECVRVIELVEWCVSEKYMYECPTCHANSSFGHNSGCEVAAAIATARKSLQGE